PVRRARRSCRSPGGGRRGGAVRKRVRGGGSRRGSFLGNPPLPLAPRLPPRAAAQLGPRPRLGRVRGGRGGGGTGAAGGGRRGAGRPWGWARRGVAGALGVPGRGAPP